MFQSETLNAYFVPYKIDTLEDCRGNPNCQHVYLPVKMAESPMNQNYLKQYKPVHHFPDEPKEIKVIPLDQDNLKDKKQLDNDSWPEKLLPIKPQNKSSTNQVKLVTKSSVLHDYPKKEQKSENDCSKCSVHKQIVNIALPIANKNHIKPSLSKDSSYGPGTDQQNKQQPYIPYVISFNPPDNLDF